MYKNSFDYKKTPPSPAKWLIKNLLLIFLSYAEIVYPTETFSSSGDTTTVQTFTFGSPQYAWFVFPSATENFEKIYMKYTLKCNPAQTPACGEWDYLTYSYLYDHTGKYDSTLLQAPSFTVGGTTPDTIMFINTPSYTYNIKWQYFPLYTDTVSLTTVIPDSGKSNSNIPFQTSEPVSRSQYLWKASELIAAGMDTGYITGLKFYIQTTGSAMHNLIIKMKHTTADSLTTANYEKTGFTIVFSGNTEFDSTGWNNIQLPVSFNWNGSSNLLLEITYDNSSSGSDIIISSDSTSYNTGVYSTGRDRVLSFNSYGYVDVPNSIMTKIDSFITIALWAYGDPDMQPQDGTCFEGVDINNNRIINTHVPWSDNNVYWDAGFTPGYTGYNRINKAATSSEIEGQWNYWTFTKNVSTGSMKIYLNGNLWHSGSGMKKAMSGIKKFWIGKGTWNGSQTFKGEIDEFTIWNTELDQATIKNYMYKNIDATHPYYSNLILYYQFNEWNYITAADSSINSAHGTLLSVNNPLLSAESLFRNFQQTYVRPHLAFEQGVYTSYLDSFLVEDSAMNEPMQIITYLDSLNPTTATDTIIAWSTYYNQYLYDSTGIAYDSTLVSPDNTFYLKYNPYYKPFEVINRYEISRYITPYGYGIDLGSGWTWTFDVSDYSTLLHDSVHLAAGNWQELLDMKFLMIKGTPPRDVLSIQNLWTGQFVYGVTSDPIENHLQPKTISIPANALNARLKSRITGHGFGGNENCAEFCPKNHYFVVNGITQFSQLVWRNNCAYNPLYPQGGTWIYQRANWCPGAEVWTYDFELTPYISPGSSVVLDHDVEDYSWNGGGSLPYYAIEDQLITYGAPNFTLDAAVEDVLSPSADIMHSRLSPVCHYPVVRIKNTGSTTLTSLDISYGRSGTTPWVYHWTGSLKFSETTDVTLDEFDYDSTTNTFAVTVSNPNGGSDQYSNNNSLESFYKAPPSLPASFYFELKTNNYADENSYTLEDGNGNIILSKSGLAPAKIYRDTVNLTDGCYELRLTDSGEDGLSFWANSAQGNGYFRIKRKDNGSNIKNFQADFGAEIHYQFTIGKYVGLKEHISVHEPSFNIYPNPTSQMLYINIDLPERQNGTIEIYDLAGKKLYTYHFSDSYSEGINADLSSLPGGMYFIQLKTEKEIMARKFVVNKH